MIRVGRGQDGEEGSDLPVLENDILTPPKVRSEGCLPRDTDVILSLRMSRAWASS